MKKTLCIFISCLTLVATMTGCGGKDSSETASVTEAATSAAADTTTTNETNDTTSADSTSTDSKDSTETESSEIDVDSAKALIESFTLPNTYYMDVTTDAVGFVLSKDNDDFCVEFSTDVEGVTTTIRYFGIGDKLYYTGEGIDEKSVAYVADAKDLPTDDQGQTMGISFDEVQSVKLEYVDEIGNGEYKVKCHMAENDTAAESVDDGTVTIKNGEIVAISFVNTNNSMEACTIIPNKANIPSAPENAEAVSAEDIMGNFAMSMMAIMFTGLDEESIGAEKPTKDALNFNTDYSKNYPNLKVQGYATMGDTIIFANLKGDDDSGNNDDSIYFARKEDAKTVVDWYKNKEDKDLYIDVDIVEADGKYGITNVNGHSYK